jgi:hypothetical protein
MSVRHHATEARVHIAGALSEAETRAETTDDVESAFFWANIHGRLNAAYDALTSIVDLMDDDNDQGIIRCPTCGHAYPYEVPTCPYC